VGPAPPPPLNIVGIVTLHIEQYRKFRLSAPTRAQSFCNNSNKQHLPALMMQRVKTLRIKQHVDYRLSAINDIGE
jgi:hypothetical protein